MEISVVVTSVLVAIYHERKLVCIENSIKEKRCPIYKWDDHENHNLNSFLINFLVNIWKHYLQCLKGSVLIFKCRVFCDWATRVMNRKTVFIDISGHINSKKVVATIY